MAIIERVKLRLQDETYSDDQLQEYIKSATDRIMLRIGEADELPKALETIAVDITVKLFRRKYYEGIKSEGADTLRVAFIDDILKEYEDDFKRYRNSKATGNDKPRKLRFL